MTYDAAERAHDDRIHAALTAARIIVTEADHGDLVITLAHLRGEVTTCDGTMYWSVSGIADGEKYFGQSQEAGRSATAYGKACVVNRLDHTAKSVIASIDARRVAA